MYLKRIEMQGFKSFADKISIDVKPGVTAIVGPNGSGKSNISDALRWVMGEQSAKSLRSGKMEDVIFNGTQTRKPLSFASVTLILDNEEHFFASEYNELAVTRRVFRSGESEYLINGAQCRLKDIHELFMDTGLGREGYSIVGQGKIDEIISSKSEDRRQVFEEAAGISKYRHRKTEAERKLEHTEDNLVRVRDVLSELEGRVEPLRRQSEKARKFMSLKEELKGIEVSASVDIIDKNRAEAQKYDTLLKNAEEDLENEKKSLAQKEAESETLYSLMREADEKTGELHGSLDAKRAEKSRAEAEKKLEEGMIENYRSNIAAFAAEQAANERAMAEEAEKAAEFFADRDERERSLAVQRESLARSEAAGEEISRVMIEKGRLVEAAREAVRAYEKELADAQSESKGLDILKDSIETRRFSIETEMTAAKESERRFASDKAKTEEELAKAKRECDEAQRLFEKERSDAEGFSEAAEEKKNDFNRLTSLAGEKQGRLKMLEEMEKSLEGYQRSVKDLITAHKSGQYAGRITGIFSKLITVPREYAPAIEAALGGAMQNVVVPDEQDAKEAVNYLKEHRLGRVTFLPLSAQEKRRLDNESEILAQKGVIAVAADLVGREKSLDNAVEALLGRVIVADSQDSAIALSKKYRYRFKTVTLTGEEFRVGGSITGGSMNRAVSVLGRAEEIEELKREVKRLKRLSEKAEDEIYSLTEKLRDASAKREEFRRILSEKEVISSRLAAECDALDARFKEAGERIAKLEEEKREISYKMQNNSALKESYILEAKEAAERLKEAEAELKARQAELSCAMEEKDRSSSEIFKMRMELSASERDAALSGERGEMAESRIEALKSENLLKEKTKKQIGENIKKSEEKIRALTDKAEEIQKEIDCLEGELLAAAQGKSGTDERAARLREEIKKANDIIYRLQNEAVRLESAKSKLDYAAENAVNRLWDEYEMTYSEAKEKYVPFLPLPEAQKRISSIKGYIKALGNVNVDAIDEYKEVRERYDFLSAQVNDLEKAKASLEKLIKEIVGAMKDIFEEKFKTINTYFGEIFRELFGGGRASVSLTDENDILESGIEIEVQPPGKKLQSISPLSGGEKALTAIALLFALMKVSPSPFVVLDEIEAALDDINVYRFADYMRKRTDSTQFIVITHRRGTMEAADMLYGVTMQEKGVSKLLSMRLEDVKEYQE